MSVELTFDNWYGENSFFFNPSMMGWLLKGVFVLSGCVLIEKLASEMGSYFGAKNAVCYITVEIWEWKTDRTTSKLANLMV